MFVTFADCTNILSHHVSGLSRYACAETFLHDFWNGQFEQADADDRETSMAQIECNTPAARSQRILCSAQRPQVLEILFYRGYLPSGILDAKYWPYLDPQRDIILANAYHKLSKCSLSRFSKTARISLGQIRIPLPAFKAWLRTKGFKVFEDLFDEPACTSEAGPSSSFNFVDGHIDARVQSVNYIYINVQKTKDPVNENKGDSTSSEKPRGPHQQGGQESPTFPVLLEAPITPQPVRDRGRPKRHTTEILDKLKSRIWNGEVITPSRSDEARWLRAWAHQQWGDKAPAYKTIYNVIGLTYGEYRDKGIAPK